MSPGAGTDVGEPSRTSLGVVEVTISGLGDAQPTTFARSASNVSDLVAADLPSGLNASLVPVPAGDGTIQLEPLSTGSFTEGERGQGGVRYVWATYRVRNARNDGTPYDTPRQNLTFLAVDTDNTIGQSAVSRLFRFDDSAAESAIAAQILPTGAVTRDLLTGGVASAGPDVLQVFTEEEVEALSRPAGVTDIFPYGFVVRREGDATTRTLPANPAEDQFDGIVTFAFKVPLQANANDDPYTLTMTFLAVDDDEVRITQSLEEQTPEAQAAFEARAAALGADRVHLLMGGAYSGAIPSSPICAARTAGSKATPTASIGSRISLLSLTPNSGRIARDTRFTATFSAPVSGVDHTNFSVTGSVSGQAFVGQAYDGNGTDTITTPAANFDWGEKVEVVIDGLSCVSGLPYELELDVVPEPFTTSLTFSTGSYNEDAVTADVNGDGKLDLVVLNGADKTFTVVLNVDGAMQNRTPITTNTGIEGNGLTVGDVNGDGKLDVVVVGRIPDPTTPLAETYLGNGDGTFQYAGNLAVGAGPQYVALGDLNGDGNLDLATSTLGDRNFSVALGNGNGTFQSATHYALGGESYYVGFGDLDKDGNLDVVASSFDTDRLYVYWGNGAGGFAGSTTEVTTTGPGGALIADLNGDGNLDLVSASNPATGGYVEFFPGTGARTFGTGKKSMLASAPMFVIYMDAADLDGDGDLDLAVTNLNYNTLNFGLSILINDGTGSFTERMVLPVSWEPGKVSIGDLNGDGKPDVVTSTKEHPGKTYIYWN